MLSPLMARFKAANSTTCSIAHRHKGTGMLAGTRPQIAIAARYCSGVESVELIIRGENNLVCANAS